MGWSYPYISLEDLLNLIKGFVDILILASGYQSSGVPAVWSAQNIKKAVQWGLFFENVFRQLGSSDDYVDSMKELDAALVEMTSEPYFPQGLAHLSSTTLTRARDFVLRHLLHTLPLRDGHLSALLTAAVEMDLDDLRKTEYGCLNLYLDKLMLHSTSQNMALERTTFIKDSMTSSTHVVSSSADQTVYYSVSNPCAIKDSINPESPLQASDNISEFIIRELSKRQTDVSCISSVEMGLEVLSETVSPSKWVGSYSNLLEGQSHSGISPLIKEQLTELAAWNQWKSKNLSYLLDRRTARLVSGAKLIFSAPKVQWLQVFERMKVSTESRDDDLLEIIELLLLGYISSRWSRLLEHLISVSYDFLTISTQYQEVHNLLLGRSQLLHSKEETMNSKENGILEYLTMLLHDQHKQLWKLPPVLATTAIPSWSPLFRLYLTEIETQFTGASFTIRCCSCIQDGKEHKDCELAERIWCLYIFHVLGSHLMVNRGGA